MFTLLRFAPTTEVNLVPTQMYVFVRKNLSDFLEELLKKLVNFFFTRVHRPLQSIFNTCSVIAPAIVLACRNAEMVCTKFAIFVVLLCEQAWMSWFKSLGVSGCVKLAHYPDTSQPGVPTSTTATCIHQNQSNPVKSDLV